MNKFEQKFFIWKTLKVFCVLVVFQFTVILVYADGAENFVYDECTQKRTVLTRVTNELKVTRRTIKTSETALAAKQRELTAAIDYAGKLEIGRQAVSKDSYKRAALDKLYSNADASVRLNQRQLRTIEANLAKQRAEETYLVNQLHLIRDYIDEKCPKLPKPKPKPTIPNIAGNYNSSYGTTVLTQERKPEGVFITATVYYDGGNNSPRSGTSRLSGFFDGKTWVFSWRNTYGNYGTGAMGYNADGSLSGYWLNSKDKSRGNWWLRPR
jgi:hypothetical protein